MKIYTSYFGNVKKLSVAGIKVASISLYKPKYLYCQEFPQLAPKRYMLNDTLTEQQYVAMYKRDILDKLNPFEVLKVIEYFSRGKDVALCCYEKPGDFCHRYIVAEWLKEKTGTEVEEFGKVEEKDEKAVQLSLF